MQVQMMCVSSGPGKRKEEKRSILGDYLLLCMFFWVIFVLKIKVIS